MTTEWYRIANIEEIDSPALLIYKDRVLENIRTLVSSIDDVSRLRPHIKTHKSAEVSAMMLNEGISKFKCATIAEAEMLAAAGARDILLAYQPVGPKGKRFADLCIKFTAVTFSCLVDNERTAEDLSHLADSRRILINVYIDLNVGMNRTGIRPGEAFGLWKAIDKMRALNFIGLHAYDGHLRDPDFELRQRKSDQAFEDVLRIAGEIHTASGRIPAIVAGGTPTYSIHCRRKNVECSPGTFIYWDKGYEQILAEQHYLHAAVVISRVISKPAVGMICIDLGHKSIASENPLPQRVYFLDGTDLEPVGHSEEHMVLRTTHGEKYQIGDVLYGIPYHVCPTIALYERSFVVESGFVTDSWLTVSRNKKITI